MGVKIIGSSTTVSVVPSSTHKTISVFDAKPLEQTSKTAPNILDVSTCKVTVVQNILPSPEITNPLIIALYADETIKVGNAVYVNDAGKLALAGNGIPAIGISILSVNENDQAVYVSEGKISQINWTEITGAIELIKGDSYYLSGNGMLTNTIPTTGLSQRLGVAVSTSMLDVEINQPIMLA